MEKNYNYQRKKLVMPEYGRHIHQMIDYLIAIEDRQERNEQARAVIAVMGNLYPTLRDTPDFAHKLWDHLFLIADFQLDVDSPYPIPTAMSLAPVPRKLEYPRGNIRLKHYGKNIQNMIRALEEMRPEDAETLNNSISNIARYMRAKSYEYNQEHPDNAVIIKDIKNMSKNGIYVDEVALNNIKSDYKQHFLAHTKKQNFQTRNGKNGQKNLKKQKQRNNK